MSSPGLAQSPHVPDSVAHGFSRWQHLALVLWVSLAIPILGSAYYSLSGITPTYQSYRLWGGLVSEINGLLVLFYVMRNQGKSWSLLGLKPSFVDVWRAFVLFLLATAAQWIVYIPAQFLYRACSGQFLTPKSINSLFAFGISTVSIAFVCLNPFFEELIVRAYTMSELMDSGINRTLAIAISVAIQLSYHLYQGLANVLSLAILFAVMSIYYARTRRIIPIILVHLGFDLAALFKANL